MDSYVGTDWYQKILFYHVSGELFWKYEKGRRRMTLNIAEYVLGGKRNEDNLKIWFGSCWQ